MLKEITKDEVLGLMEKGETVLMLYKVDMGHTIEDILGADGFAVDVPELGNNLAELGNEVNEVNDVVNDKSNEVKSDPSEIQVESKSDPSEKKKSKYDKEMIWKLYSEEKMNANQIAERIGGTAGTVAYHIHHLKKARENES